MALNKNQYVMQAMLNLLLYLGDNGKKNPAVERIKGLTYNKTVPKRKKFSRDVSRENLIARKMNFNFGTNPVNDYGRPKSQIAG